LEKTVHIQRPSLDDIPGIIKHHLPSNSDLSKLKQASVSCRGRSQAEIAKACRDARRSAREDGRVVSAMDVADAVEASRKKMTPEDDRRAAVHEAGHAVVCILSGNKCGFVDLDACQTLTEFNTLFPTEESLTALVLSTLAGRAAEEVVFGSPCGGAAQDLQDATETVRKMLTQLGYGASRAHVSDTDFRLRRDLVSSVDERVDELYHRAAGIVRKHRREILRVATILQRDRYMTGAEVWRVIAHGSIMLRRRPELVYSAPCDNERGNPTNKSRLRYAA
jgi:ATP-dependent Zn protease